LDRERAAMEEEEDNKAEVARAARPGAGIPLSDGARMLAGSWAPGCVLLHPQEDLMRAAMEVQTAMARPSFQVRMRPIEAASAATNAATALAQLQLHGVSEDAEEDALAEEAPRPTPKPPTTPYVEPGAELGAGPEALQEGLTGKGTPCAGEGAEEALSAVDGAEPVAIAPSEDQLVLSDLSPATEPTS
jgi:hypothetical protein